MRTKRLLTLLLLLCALLPVQAQRVIPGDERTNLYYPLIEGQRIALFSNHTGMVAGRHLLDILLEQDFNVTAIFSPEHGFRGRADAGEHVASGTDPQTGVPILSLYNGREQRPSPQSMRQSFGIKYPFFRCFSTTMWRPSRISRTSDSSTSGLVIFIFSAAVASEVYTSSSATESAAFCSLDVNCSTNSRCRRKTYVPAGKSAEPPAPRR